jgi:hypothetical protein
MKQTPSILVPRSSILDPRFLVLLVAAPLLAFACLLPQPGANETTRAITAPPWPAYQPPRGYVCYRAATPPVIDGRLDDPVWRSAPWSEWFIDIEGDRKPAPRYRTRVKMLWDDQCLYIAADLEEPHIQASATQHDSYIFHFDNDFEVFLDPDGDSHLYAELEMNARNTTWDLLLTRPYKDGGHAIDAWEIAGLRTAVAVDGTLNDPRDIDRGWTIEIAWPWQGLKQISTKPVPPCDGDQWRINFSRVELEHKIVGGRYSRIGQPGKNVQNWVWSPQGVIDMHRPERWGYVQFSTAAPGTATFRADPAGGVQDLLHRIYYAQRDYRERYGSWARSLPQLGLGGLSHPSLVGPPRLEATTSFFEAQAVMRNGEGRPRTWHIASDARVWSD